MKYWINTINGEIEPTINGIPRLYKTKKDAEKVYSKVPSLVKLGNIKAVKVELTYVSK